MQDDENGKNTRRHNVRVDEDLWLRAQTKALELTREGYLPGDAQHMNRTSVNAVVRRALDDFVNETNEQSVERLKLVSRRDHA